jgi:hypothetical protein
LPNTEKKLTKRGVVHYICLSDETTQDINMNALIKAGFFIYFY